MGSHHPDCMCCSCKADRENPRYKATNKAVMWVITTNPNLTEFVGWSCGSPGPLADAAIYRSLGNANKKVKQLKKYCASGYPFLRPLQVEVAVKP